MKREPSTAARSLRAASLAISLVALVAFSTMVYSVYADYTGAISIFSGSSGSTGISATAVRSGNTTTVYLNVTISNKGLYVLGVSLSCEPSAGSVSVTCADGSVTIHPGGEDTLHFVLTLTNQDGISLSGIPIKGSLSLSLQPFASLDIGVDLSSLLGQGV